MPRISVDDLSPFDIYLVYNRYYCMKLNNDYELSISIRDNPFVFVVAPILHGFKNIDPACVLYRGTKHELI